MSEQEIQRLTLRLPKDLYNRALEVSKEFKCKSLNEFICICVDFATKRKGKGLDTVLLIEQLRDICDDYSDMIIEFRKNKKQM